MRNRRLELLCVFQHLGLNQAPMPIRVIPHITFSYLHRHFLVEQHGNLDTIYTDSIMNCCDDSHLYDGALTVVFCLATLKRRISHTDFSSIHPSLTLLLACEMKTVCCFLYNTKQAYMNQNSWKHLSAPVVLCMSCPS